MSLFSTEKAAADLSPEELEKKRLREDGQRYNREYQERLAEERKILAELDDNVEGLPTDWAWMYTHPAMHRKPTGNKKTTMSVKITIDDLKSAPNSGVAAMLDHFVNNKKEFYMKVIDFQAKQKQKESTEAEAKHVETKKTIDELKELLSGVGK
jgi:hypothetical protein